MALVCYDQFQRQVPDELCEMALESCAWAIQHDAAIPFVFINMIADCDFCMIGALEPLGLILDFVRHDTPGFKALVGLPIAERTGNQDPFKVAPETLAWINEIEALAGLKNAPPMGRA